MTLQLKKRETPIELLRKFHRQQRSHSQGPFYPNTLSNHNRKPSQVVIRRMRTVMLPPKKWKMVKVATMTATEQWKLLAITTMEHPGETAQDDSTTPTTNTETAKTFTTSYTKPHPAILARAKAGARY